MKKLLYTTVLGLALACTGCSDFLEDQVPKGTIDNEQLQNPEYVDNLVISAYAVWISAEDINSSFSMWNFDVRSDDAYKGGNGTEDGDVFHKLEISQGIMTTDWNISDMWQRLYNCISRVNAALQLLNQLDESTYPLKQQRIAEMRFLRGHGHFLLKQLYKNIVFANDENLSPEEYNNLSNTAYTNDEGWQLIADDFQFAYDNLPDTQADKGRPTKAAAAAYLAKTYLYKAYRQDNPESNEVTGINADDLKKVVQYTEKGIMSAGGYALEPDFHNILILTILFAFISTIAFGIIGSLISNKIHLADLLDSLNLFKVTIKDIRVTKKQPRGISYYRKSADNENNE